MLYPTVSGIFTVFAPALITSPKIIAKNWGSERKASSAENSTSSQNSCANFTDLTAAAMTCSGLMRSFFSMWMGLVAIKVWIRACLACATANPAARMSFSLARAKEHTTERSTTSATDAIAKASPSLAAAKPASIRSTPNRSSWRAICTFSSRVMAAPGDCSPSRKVVSKINTRLSFCVMDTFLKEELGLNCPLESRYCPMSKLKPFSLAKYASLCN